MKTKPWQDIRAKGRTPEHLARIDAEVEKEAKVIAGSRALKTPDEIAAGAPHEERVLDSVEAYLFVHNLLATRDAQIRARVEHLTKVKQYDHEEAWAMVCAEMKGGHDGEQG